MTQFSDKMTDFCAWFDVFLTEQKLDKTDVLMVRNPDSPVMTFGVPVGVIVEAMSDAPDHVKAAFRAMLTEATTERGKRGALGILGHVAYGLVMTVMGVDPNEPGDAPATQRPATGADATQPSNVVDPLAALRRGTLH